MNLFKLLPQKKYQFTFQIQFLNRLTYSLHLFPLFSYAFFHFSHDQQSVLHHLKKYTPVRLTPSFTFTYSIIHHYLLHSFTFTYSTHSPSLTPSFTFTYSSHSPSLT